MTASAPLDTAEQVRHYLATAFDTDRAYAVFRCEYGWVAQPVLTEEEVAAEAGIGAGTYVVDRATGVITAHGSLHPELIGAEYDEAVRNGEPVDGYRVYPPTWEIHVKHDGETPDVIEYRVWARSLLEPPAEPARERRLTLNRRTSTYDTDEATTHETCVHAAAWLEQQSRWTGAWPDVDSFRV
ncbi:hypothetical protein [Nocardia sp. NPDC057353]|uniref:hypothetical protein n=1 Tax=Nocardia sp. NPDC057353 TaxID=3346104 RepID=UPI003631FE91